MGAVLEAIVVGIGVVFAAIGVILLVAFMFAFGVAITSGIVALAWNVCGLYAVFGAAPLTFWQVVGVAIGLNLLRSILGFRISFNRSEA